MQVDILASKAFGCIKAPASKSMAHRLLICAALSEGKSVVSGISDSEDMLATLDCIRALGGDVEVDGDVVSICGVDPLRTVPKFALGCRESGSTLRFMLPIALLCGEYVELVASDALMKRPMGVFESLCKEHEYFYKQEKNSITIKGPLKSSEYTVVGNVSSQFISGLLFALPLLDSDSTLRILPPVESRSYIELTLSALREFGVDVSWTDENTLYIKGGQRYCAHDCTVEGDYSNAAFLDAFNLFGGNVNVLGLDENSIQGDKVYKEYFKLLENQTPTINIGNCPDLGPILFAVAAAKKGGTFTGTGRLRIKESDRAAAMAQELSKFGTHVVVKEDTVTITPKEFHAPTEAIFGHNDHRIVMATSVLLTLTGGSITDAQAVRKSFPNFFDCLKKLNVSVTTY